MKAELADSVSKTEKFERAVLKMQHEMRSRDDALRKVPSNCAQLLKDLKRKTEVTAERCGDVERRFEGTVGVEAFESAMRGKLESAAFYKVFPTNRTPQDHLRTMIRTETQAFSEEIRNMVKLWD